MWNAHYPPSADVRLAEIERQNVSRRAGNRLDAPSQYGALFDIFDTNKDGHDKAVFISLFADVEVENGEAQTIFSPRYYFFNGRRNPLASRVYL